ncbi:MAG TPA: Mur ligase family protein, partial [Gemmatimonadales bacterium]|nr:Mur ligase family protein [Gemmatimonadales bacterium]
LHVGGTNGKGSVVALTYEALRQAGWSVGSYTSPHLVDVRERFVVDGRPITPEAFVTWVERLRPEIERAGASFFDATTAIAFADFAARGVDIAVVEVGLGGRLDSTNVVQPAVSVVTRIALEHTDYLGPTLADIAREKAGIAKRGVPFVIGEESPEVRSVLRDTAERLGALVIEVPPGERYSGPIGLTGPHQRRNAAVAAAALAALPEPWRPPPEAVLRGFARARIPGRFDQRGPWIFDVAHNPDGTEGLCLALQEAGPPRPLHAVIGILRDKDWRAMLQRLLGVVDAAWLTDPPSAPAARKWDLEEVGRAVGTPPIRLVRHQAVTIEPDFDRALAAARRGAATVLVTGSFHTVGDALGRLPGFAPLG